jgi:hypothetical protein
MEDTLQPQSPQSEPVVAPQTTESSEINSVQTISKSKKLPWNIIAIAAVMLVLGVGAGMIGAYYYLQANTEKSEKTTETTHVANPTSSPTASTSPTPTPTQNTVVDQYADWKTFEQKDGYYSYKYPASWTVKQGDVDGLEWANFFADANSNKVVASITRYLDGTGCDDATNNQRTVTFGDESIQMEDYCGDKHFHTSLMVESLSDAPAKSGNQLSVTLVFDGSHDQELEKLAKSFTGITRFTP